MPKLAIYVPKDEMRLIEKWRKRINFSKVFMRALDQEIRDRTWVADAKEDEWHQAVEYYKRKLAESCQPLADAGFELGTQQVVRCKLTPEQIRNVLQLAESAELRQEELGFIEELMGDERETFHSVSSTLKIDIEAFPAWRHVAYRGFLRGVAAAWKQVCERME